MSAPTIGIGHFSLRVSDLDRSADFYLSLGMRETHPRMRNLAILELKGDTHFLLFRARKKPKPARVPFDLMVDDIDAVQRGLIARGFPAGPMMSERFSPHRSFQCPDPDGHMLTFTSGHMEEGEPD